MSAKTDYPFLTDDEAELLDLADGERGRLIAWHVIAEGVRAEVETEQHGRLATGERPGGGRGTGE